MYSIKPLRWSGSGHSLGCVRAGLGSSTEAGKPGEEQGDVDQGLLNARLQKSI